MSVRQAKRVIDIENYQKTNKPIESAIWWTSHNMDCYRVKLNRYLELTGTAYLLPIPNSYTYLCEQIDIIEKQQEVTQINMIMPEQLDEQPEECCNAKEIETLKDELNKLKAWAELIKEHNYSRRIDYLEKVVGGQHKIIEFNLRQITEMTKNIIDNYNTLNSEFRNI
jgi:hypothetical protein